MLITIIWLLLILFIAPARADCLTDSIGDNGPGALTRYQRCRDMENRIEALLERTERDRKGAEQQREQGARSAHCVKIAKTTDQYFDCVQAGRPRMTKEQFEDARRHLFPESETAQFQAHVRACVEEENARRIEIFAGRARHESTMTGQACSALTPSERNDAAQKNTEELTNFLKRRNQRGTGR